MTNREADPSGSDIDVATLGAAVLAADVVDPGDLVDRMRALFVSSTSAVDLSLHLIDYHLMSLRPIEPSGAAGLLRPEKVDDSVPGETFRHQRAIQRAVPAGYLQHVPVSVRGQRLGVLTGTFVAEPSATDIRTLRAVALAVAHSLLEAGAGTDAYEVGRRHGRMSVAAEMQWQLLPARAYRTSHFYVAGHLEPALHVAGDAFDFVANEDVLTLAVIDATGTEGAPSLVTTLAITALRNARRSGLSLAEQASLCSDVVWQHFRGREHVATLLVELDGRTGRATAVDAGSPVLVRLRHGEFTQLSLDDQTPLGMFDATTYAEESIDLLPGDRAYAFTDGAFMDNKTPADLIAVLASETRSGICTPPESIRRLVAELTSGGREPEDDITAVCVDWQRVTRTAAGSSAARGG